MATTTLTHPQDEAPELFTPADVGRLAGAHPNWAKRIGEELRIEPIRTPNGMRLYTRDQAERIAREIERRRHR